VITQKEAKERLEYNAETGVLTWKKKGHGVSVGNQAGGVRSDGYVCIKLDYRGYLAHRIIWLWVYGEFPDGEIDHINHNREDNRLENLRVVSTQGNAKNRSRAAINTSGVTGVSWNKKEKKWMSYIQRRRLGSYVDFFEAVCIRKSAEKKYNFHENHGKVAA